MFVFEMDKVFFYVFVFYSAVCVAVCEESKNETSSINDDAKAVEISVGMLKKVSFLTDEFECDVSLQYRVVHKPRCMIKK